MHCRTVSWRPSCKISESSAISEMGWARRRRNTVGGFGYQSPGNVDTSQAGVELSGRRATLRRSARMVSATPRKWSVIEALHPRGKESVSSLPKISPRITKPLGPSSYCGVPGGRACVLDTRRKGLKVRPVLGKPNVVVHSMPISRGLTPPPPLSYQNTREGVQADGQAVYPFEHLRSSLGVGKGALGELSGPTSRVSSATFFETLRGMLLPGAAFNSELAAAFSSPASRKDSSAWRSSASSHLATLAFALRCFATAESNQAPG